MVKGTISLARHTAQTIFDPSATHSFISDTFAPKFNQPRKSLNLQLAISTPIGTEMTSNIRYKECEMVLGKLKHL